MAIGTIKNLVSDRGFGFIVPEHGTGDGKDMFFHRTDVQGSVSFEQLRVGERVEFDVSRDERRGTAKADNVRSAPSA